MVKPFKVLTQQLVLSQFDIQAALQNQIGVGCPRAKLGEFAFTNNHAGTDTLASKLTQQDPVVMESSKSVRYSTAKLASLYQT